MSRRTCVHDTFSRRAITVPALLLGAAVIAVATVAGASVAPPPRLTSVVSVSSTGAATAAATAASCATATECLAVGTTSTTVGAASFSSDAGQSWSPLAAVDSPSIARLTGIACPSATTCVAVGSSSTKPAVGVVANLSGGVWRWSPPVTITAASNPTADQLIMNAVSCVSASSCVSVGEDQSADTPVMSYTNDGGRTWTAAVPVGGDNAIANGFQVQLNAITCPSSTTCIAVGNDSADNGMVAVATLDSQTNVWSFAASSDLVTGVNSNTGRLAGISCASSTRCVAVGQDRAGDGVDSEGFQILGNWIWTNEADITADTTHVGQLTAVHCQATGDCVAVGQDVSGVVTTTSTDDGSTWTVEAPIPSTASGPLLAAVTCVSFTHCLAVGGATTTPSNDPMIATTSDDAGASWHDTQTVASSVPAYGALNNISCPSVTHCVAVGVQYDTDSYVAVSNNGGATWGKEEVLPTSASNYVNFGLVSCPSTKLCVVAGRDSSGSVVAIRSTNGGRSWSSPTTITSDASGGGEVDALVCPTTTRCLAAGTDKQSNKTIAISTNGGLTWSAERALPTSTFSAGTFVSLSCPSATRCVALGADTSNSADAALSTDGGLTWRPVKLSAPLTLFYSVSCTSATRCAAVGNYEGVAPAVIVSSNGGATWSTLRTLKTGAAGAAYFIDVSCSTTSACVAVGAADKASGVYATSSNGGRSWSVIHEILGPHQTPDYFGGVDCLSATRCALVGAGVGFLGVSATVRFAATVHFAARGGHGTMAPQVAFTSTRLHADAFTRSGYRFAGWATSPRGSVRYKDRSRFPFAANVTLYAVWSPNP